MVTSKAFEWFIMICILLNTLVMSMRYHRMSKGYSTGLEYTNYVFAVIFNLEMVFKLIGLSWRYFTVTPWNIFDS